MALEGFWIFVFIVIATTLFIFIMTRGPKDEVNANDDEVETAG